MARVQKKWSYSRWAMYHQCPAQYEWHYILKHKRGRAPAMDRGIDIHKKAEGYVDGTIIGMPDALKNFKSEFMHIRREYKKGKGFTEPDISLTAKLEASTKFETDWFIGFADYAHFSTDLTVIDYKTGRKYPGHRDQGHAYSTALLCLNPTVQNITVEFWYLDMADPDKNVTTFEYDQTQRAYMLNLWRNRINKMYADKVFEMTPHKYCKSCARNKRNGGDCDG